MSAAPTIPELRDDVAAQPHAFVVDMQRAPDPEMGRPGVLVALRPSTRREVLRPGREHPAGRALPARQRDGGFMPPDAPHGRDLDALWEAHLGYMTLV
jgi:hypothetical protein